MRVISASRSKWIAPFTGLQPGQFRKSVRVVARPGGEAITDGRPGRQRRLDLADRVLPVAIDTDTRLVIATGDPQPGNRNNGTAHRDSDIARVLDGRPAMAHGGYQGNPEVIMPHRKPVTAAKPRDRQEDPDTVRRSFRARAEHTLARMNNRTIPRDHRRAAHTLRDTASGIARLHNLTPTG